VEQNNSSARGRVEAVLAAAGVDVDIRVFPAGTRTAADAAAAIGCQVAEIAKSIVLRAAKTGDVVVIVTSGSNRVDEGKVARHLGQPVARADADFVKARTGFTIGGVAPVGHLHTPLMLIDADLMQFDYIWAAAGTGDSVFRLTPAALRTLTSAPVADVKQE